MRDIGYTWLPVSDPCSKHGPISNDFWDKRRYWSENLFPPVFKSPPPLRVLTSERRLGWKTGMMALAIWWWEKVWRFSLQIKTYSSISLTIIWCLALPSVFLDCRWTVLHCSLCSVFLNSFSNVDCLHVGILSNDDIHESTVAIIVERPPDRPVEVSCEISGPQPDE